MNHAIKKKSIVFLISDFMDEGYEKILRIVGKKHDLIGIVINDEREKSIPKMGLVKFTDVETGNERWIDTSSPKVQNWISQYYQRLISERKTLFIKSHLDSIEIKTGENYVTPLVNFFRLRERRW